MAVLVGEMEGLCGGLLCKWTVMTVKSFVILLLRGARSWRPKCGASPLYTLSWWRMRS